MWTVWLKLTQSGNLLKTNAYICKSIQIKLWKHHLSLEIPPSDNRIEWTQQKYFMPIKKLSPSPRNKTTLVRLFLCNIHGGCILIHNIIIFTSKDLIKITSPDGVVISSYEIFFAVCKTNTNSVSHITEVGKTSKSEMKEEDNFVDNLISICAWRIEHI